LCINRCGGTGICTVLSCTAGTREGNVNMVIVILSEGSSVTHGSPSRSAVDSLFPDDVLKSQIAEVSSAIFSQLVHGRHVSVVPSTSCSGSPQIGGFGWSVRMGSICCWVCTKSLSQRVKNLSVSSSVGVTISSEGGWETSEITTASGRCD